MKKMISVAFVAALLATGVGVKANAADNTLGTQAQFNIQDGNLNLIEAPYFNFGDVKVQDIADKSGKKFYEIKDNVTDNGSNNVIKVSNYDTNVTQWTVSANATDFVSGKNKLNNAKILINNNNISGNNATILTSGTNILSTTTTSLNGKTKLDLTSVSADGLKSGKYSSDITWTLSNTTPTQSASSFK